MLNQKSACETILDTRFRYVQNEKTARSTSAISTTGIKGLKGGKDLQELIDTTAVERQGKEEIFNKRNLK